MFSRDKGPLLLWLWQNKCAILTPSLWKSATRQKTKEKLTEIDWQKKVSTCQKTSSDLTSMKSLTTSWTKTLSNKNLMAILTWQRNNFKCFVNSKTFGKSIKLSNLKLTMKSFSITPLTSLKPIKEGLNLMILIIWVVWGSKTLTIIPLLQIKMRWTMSWVRKVFLCQISSSRPVLCNKNLSIFPCTRASLKWTLIISETWALPQEISRILSRTLLSPMIKLKTSLMKMMKILSWGKKLILACCTF